MPEYSKYIPIMKTAGPIWKIHSPIAFFGRFKGTPPSYQVKFEISEIQKNLFKFCRKLNSKKI